MSIRLKTFLILWSVSIGIVFGAVGIWDLLGGGPLPLQHGLILGLFLAGLGSYLAYQALDSRLLGRIYVLHDQIRLLKSGKIRDLKLPTKGADQISEVARECQDALGELLRRANTAEAVKEDMSQKYSLRELEVADVQRKLDQEEGQRKHFEAVLQKVIGEFEQKVKERTQELTAANEKLKAQVEQRTIAEEEVRTLHAQLEGRVHERTQELSERSLELSLVNEMLVKEIEDRKSAEGERQKLVSLVENSNDFIALATLDGQVTFVNDSGRSLVGATNSRQILGLTLSDLEAESSRGCFKTRVLPHLDASGIWEGEMEFRHLSETRQIGVEVSALLVREQESGKPLCVALIVRDITERRQAEAALRQLEERFSKAFQASPGATAIVSYPDGKFVDVNQNFLKVFGYAVAEVNGSTMASVKLWMESKDWEKFVSEANTKHTLREFRSKWVTRAGQVREVLVAAEWIELGHESCILIVAEDISERLRLEEQLLQSQKMEAVGQLAAGIAHDFNNILTVVSGHASLLMSEPVMAGGPSEALKRMSDATDRAAKLTRQLLTFSRKRVAHIKDVDINQVVKDLGGMLRSLIAENISILYQYGAELPQVRADIAMIEQVIVNLVVNARDAMPTGGTILIDTTLEEVGVELVRRSPKARTGKFACITIVDTGCGMDEATMGRIFEPFFTTKEVGKGTGLGLAMVYGVIEQHNGWIDVTSKPGKGTTFRIYLPVSANAPDKPRKTEPEKENVVPMRGGSETILVVEDEPGLRMLVESVLQKLGYRVILASNGVEAMALWAKHKDEVNLLLTDMVMPAGMTGLEVSQRMRSDRQDLRFIYMSGYSVELMEHEMSGLKEGLNFLPKPYHPAQLARAVREILDMDKALPLPERIQIHTQAA